jgi:hypothetical protein
VDPKEQNKSRRHQRATADAGQPDDEANASSENDVADSSRAPREVRKVPGTEVNRGQGWQPV